MNDKARVALTARWLGTAGLIPFCAMPLLMVADAKRTSLYFQAVAVYGLAIVCFLAGSWWGIALLRRRPDMLVFSNVLVIVACLSLLFLEGQFMLVALALILFVQLLTERVHPVFAPQPEYYKTLRVVLTATAMAALFFAGGLVS